MCLIPKWQLSLTTTCPPMSSLPVSPHRSAPPHSSSAWGVEKCADIKTRGFATVQTQWHSSSGRWCEGGAVRRAAVRSLRNAISPPCFPDMSASPMARAATQGQDIPTRRVVITSEEDMPAGLQLCLCMTHSVFYLKLYFTASYIYTLPSKTKKIVRIYVYFADWRQVRSAISKTFSTHIKLL